MARADWGREIAAAESLDPRGVDRGTQTNLPQGEGAVRFQHVGRRDLATAQNRFVRNAENAFLAHRKVHPRESTGTQAGYAIRQVEPRADGAGVRIRRRQKLDSIGIDELPADAEFDLKA